VGADRAGARGIRLGTGLRLRSAAAAPGPANELQRRIDVSNIVQGWEPTTLGRAAVASGWTPTMRCCCTGIWTPRGSSTCTCTHLGSFASHRWEPTVLGRAAVASGLGPDDALLLHRDLDAAGEHLNTKSELHALYLVTEVRDTLGKIDWHRVYSVFDCLKVGLSSLASEDPRFGPRRTLCA